jgi:amidohydrolase
MLLQKIKSQAKNYFEFLRDVRRHLHKHPELSFKEFETSKYIQKQLQDSGIEFRTGYVQTGIVALIKGKNPEKKTILIRGDMDALPIQEKNDNEYRSCNDGVMHACGHDVHTTCALGAAKILNDFKNEWEGTVKIMFQPGEEVLPGGAGLMIKAGVLEDPKVEKAIALHVFPNLEAGNVGFKEGMYMASTDELHLTVNGKGGHAAMPSEYINPLVIASEIILAVENRFMNGSVQNENRNKGIPTVVAFGKITGEGATNVIPEKVLLEGTFRTMNEEWREEVHNELKKIVAEISGKYKITSDLIIEKGYPFLVNDIKFTRNCQSAAVEYLGPGAVSELPIRMTAEDFAFISQKVPSCFFRLGTGNKARGITSGVHTPTFDIDESALETGAGLMAWLAVSELSK